MISLRESYQLAAINPGPLATGIRAWSKAGPDAFPFSSLRALCKSLAWPNQFFYQNEWPSEIYVPQGPGGSWNGETQGIAIDDEHYWYLVTCDALWYFSYGALPVKPLPASQEAIVENSKIVFRGRRQLIDTKAQFGPKHLSAPALVGKLLLVPAEGKEMPGDNDELWVWVFDTDTLGYLGRFSVKVAVSGSFPWCAVSQDGRLMYTSPYPITDRIYVYRLPDLKQFGLPVQPSTKMAIESLNDPAYPSLKSDLIGQLRIYDPGGAEAIMEIQGGCVSPNGHLYMSFQKVLKNGESESCKGVLGFDLLTGHARHFISSDRGDEVEGVFAITDRVHVLHLDNNLGSNRFTISHYAADTLGT